MLDFRCFLSEKRGISDKLGGNCLIIWNCVLILGTREGTFIAACFTGFWVKFFMRLKVKLKKGNTKQ